MRNIKLWPILLILCKCKKINEIFSLEFFQSFNDCIYFTSELLFLSKPNRSLQKEKLIVVHDDILKNYLNDEEIAIYHSNKNIIYSITVYAEKQSSCCQPDCCWLWNNIANELSSLLLLLYCNSYLALTPNFVSSI